MGFDPTPKRSRGGVAATVTILSVSTPVSLYGLEAFSLCIVVVNTKRHVRVSHLLMSFLFRSSEDRPLLIVGTENSGWCSFTTTTIGDDNYGDDANL